MAMETPEASAAKRRCIKFVEGIQVVVDGATENHGILGREPSREPA